MFTSRLGVFLVCCLVLVSCVKEEKQSLIASLVPYAHLPETTHSKDAFNASEKSKQNYTFNHLYTLTELPPSIFPVIDNVALSGLNAQRTVLKYKSHQYNQSIGNLQINHSQLHETIDLLELWQHILPIGIEKQLEAYQIWGNNRMGKVRFTGYFAPIIKASKEATATFKYPIYATPLYCPSTALTRQEIEAGAIKDCAEILAYAASKVDIYYMQLQGSGYVEYPNGKTELLAYASSNGYRFNSIEAYLSENQNVYDVANISMDGIKGYLNRNPELVDSVLNADPSYVFFRRTKDAPSGAGLVALTPEMSVAVDPKYIPLGSTLLAEIPKIGRNGKIEGLEYKILLAQDVGGAIKGAGHIDIYFGAGKEAKEKAKHFSHYGIVWLLLPKQSSDVFQQFDPALTMLK